MEIEYFLLPVIALLAFFLKGVTGTGVTTVIVACASFFIDPKTAVVLAAFVNVFGGISMIRVDPVPLQRHYWLPVAVMMVIGSAAGSMALKFVSPEFFKLILGIAFFLSSLWFLFRPTLQNAQPGIAPPTSNPADLGVGLFSGFCGGFIGINAPLLVLHFGRILGKKHLRRLLVLIFIPSAMTQTATYAFNGLLTQKIIFYGLGMLPCMAVGIYLGNKSFHLISELWFRRILGVFLIIVSARLIYSGL